SFVPGRSCSGATWPCEGTDRRAGLNRFAVRFLQEAADVAGGPLEEAQNAGIAVVVEKIARVARGLAAKAAERQLEHGMDRIERAGRGGEQLVLELLDPLVELLQRALQRVEPGIALDPAHLLHHAADLGRRHAGELQGR